MTQTRKVQKPAKQGNVSPKVAKEAVKTVTEARTFDVGDVSTESNTVVTPKGKTSQKASQKVKPTIASLSSEVDSLKARLENSKKYSEELEKRLVFASSKILNLESDLDDLAAETWFQYTKRKVVAFFTFGF